MKKCKYCQSEIDSQAKICPNCRKKQGMPKWVIILIVIVAFMVIGSFGDDSSENKPTGETSVVEDITLLDGHTGKTDGNYTYEITGTIQNNKDRDYSYVQIQFYTYDKDGNMLDTCLANNSGLEANGKWKFTATCFFSDGNSKKVKSYKLKEITKW